MDIYVNASNFAETDRTRHMHTPSLVFLFTFYTTTVGNSHSLAQQVLYPSLRVEIPEIKIERVGDLPPRLIRPVGVESLDLEIDGYLGSLVTAKGHGLAKLAPQLPIGSL